MGTISTRVDDQIKAEAERIAEEIGIPLSTAINIFIKRFINEKGFPFQVNVKSNTPNHLIVDEDLLDISVKKAIADSNNDGRAPQFSYYDPVTKKLITVHRGDSGVN